MSVLRKVSHILTSIPTVEGAGVHLRRVLGRTDSSRTDPFLLLDDFRSERREDYQAGFPWHPHRGIETITYMLQGRVEHSDSLGNQGTILPGGVQWMTAGSGIVHQEMPAGDAEGRMGGVQLWANLPAHCKMMPPRYREFAAAEIPDVPLPDGGLVRVIAGTFQGVRGPVRDILIAPFVFDVTLQARAELAVDVPDGATVLAYVLTGEVQPSPERDAVAATQGVLWERTGDTLMLSAGAAGARALLIGGQPLHEPVAWYGPIVMNTQDEIQAAMRELHEGTFVRDYAPGDKDLECD